MFSTFHVRASVSDVPDGFAGILTSCFPWIGCVSDIHTRITQGWMGCVVKWLLGRDGRI